MTPLEIEFIEKTLGSEHKQFYYFRDKYALQILQYHVKNSMKINELKSSRVSRFDLTSKIVQECAKGSCGDSTLAR